MPIIALPSILALVKSGGGETFNRRNDAEYWSVVIEGNGEKRKGNVVAASFEAGGVMLSVEDGDKVVTLVAAPASLGKTKVLVNGELDPDAAMVFDPKPSIGNWTRYAFDFKRVTIDGEDYRFNFRYDP